MFVVYITLFLIISLYSNILFDTYILLEKCIFVRCKFRQYEDRIKFDACKDSFVVVIVVRRF